MTYRPGATVPATGIYWCSVCKLPAQFTAGQQFPECRNMCGRASGTGSRNAGPVSTGE